MWARAEQANWKGPAAVEVSAESGKRMEGWWRQIAVGTKEEEEAEAKVNPPWLRPGLQLKLKLKLVQGVAAGREGT